MERFRRITSSYSLRKENESLVAALGLELMSFDVKGTKDLSAGKADPKEGLAVSPTQHRFYERLSGEQHPCQ
jgi:hypothetical protein